MFLLLCSEKASLAVTLVNANNDVMGNAAFFDYPNLPSVDPGKWEEWLHSKYDCKKCNVCMAQIQRGYSAESCVIWLGIFTSHCQF